MLAASLAWLVSPASWRLDLIANLTAQISFANAALLLVWAVLRRYGLLTIALLAIIAQAMVLLPGRAPGAHKTSDPATIVRLLTVNAYVDGASDGTTVRLLDACDADVFTIVESNSDVVAHLRRSEDFRQRYPHMLPPWPFTSKPTIVSKWPLEPINLKHEDVAHLGLNPGISPSGAIVQRPGGAFVLISTHPASPRTDQSWRNGNEAMRQLGDRINNEIRSLGLPVVIGGDFNATPTGWRSRSFRDTTNLRRGKPALKPVGTWPGMLPWPARLAIDDVFVSADVGIVSWETHPPAPGGDHSPVLIEIAIPLIPAAPASESTEDSSDLN